MRRFLGKATEAGIEIHMGKRLVAIDETEDSVKVTFEDGTMDTCDILVGADGIHSVVRTMHVHPSFEPSYTGLSSLYSLVPIRSIKSPLYFKGNFGAIMLSSGYFSTGFYDKARQHMYWWNTHEAAAKDRDEWTAMERSPSYQATSQGEDAEYHHSIVKEIIDISPDIKFYPIYTLPSGGKWYTGRTILIGDAAHGTTPLFCI